jgi:hypothetical protein
VLPDSSNQNLLPAWTSIFKSRVKVAYRTLIGPNLYEQLEFRRHLAYWPNLDKPQTFNEKICARKFRPFPSAEIYADKFAVRDFVRKRVGSEVLTRLFYAGNRPSEIDYAVLPARFVLKGTHGSGPDLRMLVRNKSLLTRRRFVSLASQILRRRCGPEVNEWWYERITPRILIEEMLLNDDGSFPVDFKFYVFNGIAHYVQVIDGRHKVPRSGFYNREWVLQPFTRELFGTSLEREQPPNFTKMLEVSEALAAGMDFVRVDLYDVRGRVIFGEITLAPGAGWIPFRPAIYDHLLGRCWSNA